MADVDREVKKRVRLAAVQSDTSVSAWIERAVLRELERETLNLGSERCDDITLPSQHATLRLPEEPVVLRGGEPMAETVLDDRGDR